MFGCRADYILSITRSRYASFTVTVILGESSIKTYLTSSTPKILVLRG